MTDFAQLGRDAYANGRMRAPALDATVRDALVGLPIGSPEAHQVMRAFTDGWDAAADAAALAALAE